MANRLKTEFLLGIGVGCIISAFLVSVFGVGTISDQQVMARAAKLGMVQPAMSGNTNPADVGPQTTEQSQTKEQSHDTEKSGTTEKSPPLEQSAGTQGEKQDTVPSSENGAQSAKAEAETSSSGTTAITITNRMGSETIARILEENGVIEDQYEFLQVVSKHDAHKRLQTGTFTFPVGSDLEEVLYLLLGKKR